MFLRGPRSVLPLTPSATVSLKGLLQTQFLRLSRLAGLEKAASQDALAQLWFLQTHPHPVRPASGHKTAPVTKTGTVAVAEFVLIAAEAEAEAETETEAEAEAADAAKVFASACLLPKQ